ncbi:MAG: DoxX family protein [Rhodothermales bacterium]|nr:DoxX family protein [Rhodothermales bacterium]
MINKWEKIVSGVHVPWYVDAVRIATGAVLAAGGVQYILSQSSAMRVLEETGLDFISSTLLIPLFTLAILVGGILLIFGLLTRLAASVQVPLFILFLFGHELRSEVPGIHYAVWFDVALLVAIVVCVVFGSGRFSLDAYMREKQFKAVSDVVLREEEQPPTQERV